LNSKFLGELLDSCSGLPPKIQDTFEIVE